MRRSKKDELAKPFVKIGDFYIGYRKFLSCLKPRGIMNDEVMSLCIEKFDLAALGSSNKGIKKYMFSVYMSDRLIKDPSSFEPRIPMRVLQRAVNKYKVQKFDLLFFTIVHEGHWIVVCANLLPKQWNVFDSLTGKGRPTT